MRARRMSSNRRPWARTTSSHLATSWWWRRTTVTWRPMSFCWRGATSARGWTTVTGRPMSFWRRWPTSAWRWSAMSWWILPPIVRWSMRRLSFSDRCMTSLWTTTLSHWFWSWRRATVAWWIFLFRGSFSFFNWGMAFPRRFSSNRRWRFTISRRLFTNRGWRLTFCRWFASRNWRFFIIIYRRKCLARRLYFRRWRTTSTRRFGFIRRITMVRRMWSISKNI